MKDSPLKKWFAPCIDISPNGVFLLQKKTEPCSTSKYPTVVPSFFTDLKYQNFGLLNGKVVCFDYGTILFTNLNEKTRKAKWWSED